MSTHYEPQTVPPADPRVEDVMEKIYELAESLVPERMARGEWLPSDAQHRLAAIQDHITALLADAARDNS